MRTLTVLAEIESELATIQPGTGITDPVAEELKRRILEQAAILYRSPTLSAEAAASANLIIDIAEQLMVSDPRAGLKAIGFVWKCSQTMTEHHQRAARTTVELINSAVDPVPAIEFAMEITHRMSLATPAFQEIRLQVLKRLPTVDAPQEWKADIVKEIARYATIGSELHKEAIIAQQQYTKGDTTKHLSSTAHPRVKQLPSYEGKQ